MGVASEMYHIKQQVKQNNGFASYQPQKWREERDRGRCQGERLACSANVICWGKNLSEKEREEDWRENLRIFEGTISPYGMKRTRLSSRPST